MLLDQVIQYLSKRGSFSTDVYIPLPGAWDGSGKTLVVLVKRRSIYGA